MSSRIGGSEGNMQAFLSLETFESIRWLLRGHTEHAGSCFVTQDADAGAAGCSQQEKRIASFETSLFRRLYQGIRPISSVYQLLVFS